MIFQERIELIRRTSSRIKGQLMFTTHLLP